MAPRMAAGERARPVPVPAGRPAGGHADRVPWLIAVVVFAAYATISISRYVRLDPGSWDLGIFTEEVKQYAHFHLPVANIRGPGFDLLGDHFSPIVALAAPFFRLFPTPVTLLVIQALLTAVSVIPVCRAGQELLGTGPSRVIGLAYGFSWGLQQMINFDFHEVAFAVPLIAFALSALVRGRAWATVAWAMPLVFVKEDQGIRMAVVGALMVAAAAFSRLGRGHGPGTWWLARARARGADARPGTWAKAGTVLMVWGLGWSALAILVIIPHFNLHHHYLYVKDGGLFSLTGGHFSLSHLLAHLTAHGQVKLRTAYLIGLPVAFLVLLSPFTLVALPSLLARFASTNHYFWLPLFHYNATLMPVVFIGAIDALAWLALRAARGQWAVRRQSAERHGPGAGPGGVPGADRWLRRFTEALMLRPYTLVGAAGAGIMIVLAGLTVSQYPLSSLAKSQTYTISPHVRVLEAAMARIPSGTTVESTLTTLASLGARDTTYWIGNANPPPRYILFDDKSPDLSLPRSGVPAYVRHLHPGVSYRQIFDENGVFVFRRAGSGPTS